jgi:hypothetical protein
LAEPGLRGTVEHHRDVRAGLDVGGLLRREQVRGAIEMRTEARALFGNGPARREAEHLIAAAVGEDRLLPSDEPVEAAHARDEIVAGPQIEVIGVAQQNLRADVFEIAMRHTLHRTLGADGHERGVSIAPWGVTMRPRRARPSVRQKIFDKSSLCA